jgi:hypothetical protein
MFGPFLVFWAPKTHFRTGRHENKEKILFFFGPNPNSKIQKIQKSTLPNI